MKDKTKGEVKVTVLSDSLWPSGLYSPWNSPGQNTGVGCLSLLQEIFPTQGSNPGLPHYRQILYQLSHEGRPNQVKKRKKEKEKNLGIEKKLKHQIISAPSSSIHFKLNASTSISYPTVFCFQPFVFQTIWSLKYYNLKQLPSPC